MNARKLSNDGSLFHAPAVAPETKHAAKRSRQLDNVISGSDALHK